MTRMQKFIWELRISANHIPPKKKNRVLNGEYEVLAGSTRERSGDHKYSDMVMEARWARLLPTPECGPRAACVPIRRLALSAMRPSSHRSIMIDQSSPYASLKTSSHRA